MLRPTARAKSPRIVPVRQRASSTHSQGTCSEFWTHTRCRRERVGRTKDRAASLDGVKTLEDDSDNGARCHVLDQAREEGLALEVGIVWDCMSVKPIVFTIEQYIRFSRCSSEA